MNINPSPLYFHKMVENNNLENISGPLFETYGNLVKGTMQHAYQINEQRENREDLNKARFYVAESSVIVRENGEFSLYLTRGEENNLILNNLPDVQRQLQEFNGRYEHYSQKDITRVISDHNVKQFDLNSLTMHDFGGGFDEHGANFSLPLNRPDLLNSQQKDYVARVLTENEDYGLAVERLKMMGIESATFSFLSPASIKNIFNFYEWLWSL